MLFAPGVKLGPYDILSPLGAGGMGEAYRAREKQPGQGKGSPASLKGSSIVLDRREGDQTNCPLGEKVKDQLDRLRSRELFGNRLHVRFCGWFLEKCR